MTTNLSAGQRSSSDCLHSPPVNVADLRVAVYAQKHRPAIYDFLGGAESNIPGCMVSYELYGKDFAFGLGSNLMAGGKSVIYARLSPDEEPPLKPLNGNPLDVADLRDRKLIVTSDCLTPEERVMVDRRLEELRGGLGFGDVAYALEKETE